MLKRYIFLDRETAEIAIRESRLEAQVATHIDTQMMTEWRLFCHTD